jgi:hypothetical protein
MNLVRIQAVGLKWAIAVGGDRPVVAESDESTHELSWEPQVLSARGP